jgi:hypothetical protein
MSAQTTTREKTPPEFAVIESYERMLIQRERDPHAYQLQHSMNEKRALEHYVSAKSKAEREGQAWLN